MTELNGTKGFLASKTNLTGILIALFGVLGLLGVLPASLDATSTVNLLVAAGGALVVLFRTFATKKIASSTAV